MSALVFLSNLPLVGGLEALVDSDDLPRLIERRWYVKRSKGRPVSIGSWSKSPTEYVILARLLMEPPPGHWVDHINGDVFDNRKANLRVCSPVQNAWNKRRRKSGGKFPYKGVSEGGGRYFAKLLCNGVRVRLGGHATPEAAARAYDRGAREHFGEFAACNFPVEGDGA